MATSKKRTARPARKKAAGSRKKTRISSALSFTKYLVIWIAMVVFIAICTLAVYDFFYPRQQQRDAPQVTRGQQAPPTGKAETRKPEGAGKAVTGKKQPAAQPASAVSFPAHAEIPRLQAARKEQVIRYTGHTVSYNVEYKLSNWVAWELTGQEAKSKEHERSNKFVPDPTLRGQTAMNEDYSRTGYDKGHLLPAGDVKWSAKAMRESFYYSNICPQVPGLNRGIWKDLEEQCRLWAKEYGTLLIVTGPVMDDDLKRLGKNRVAIPRRFYKVIATITGQRYEGIAFVLENKDYGNASLTDMALPIDSVETLTGIDFFPALPDPQEKEMETKINHACWSF